MTFFCHLICAGAIEGILMIQSNWKRKANQRIKFCFAINFLKVFFCFVIKPIQFKVLILFGNYFLNYTIITAILFANTKYMQLMVAVFNHIIYECIIKQINVGSLTLYIFVFICRTIKCTCENPQTISHIIKRIISVWPKSL